MKADQQSALLSQLRNAMGAGAAETDQLGPSHFLPVAEHLRVLEPTAKLILGAKGSGKSGLFAQLTDPVAARRLGEIAEASRIRTTPLDRTDWVTGFTISGLLFPSSEVLGPRIKALGTEFRLGWLALLVRALLESGLELVEPPTIVRELGTLSGTDVMRPVEALRSDDVRVEVSGWLDAIERQLVERDRWLFVVYDDLDVLSQDDWKVVQDGIGELVRYWATASRRYRRLQPKLFMRSDIYNRIAVGPDIGKLSLGGVELQWTAGDLYAMLVKRMVSSSDQLREYLRPTGLKFDEDAVFGPLPSARSERSYKPFADRIVGPFMGANVRKGYTYTWIPNHLQDGNGLLFPRPAVQLFDSAAKQEQRQSRAEGQALLHHSSLRAALDDVSNARVRELTEQEFPWMEPLAEEFRQHGYRVPFPRVEFERALSQVRWPDHAVPPSTEPAELAEHLEELGIARRRTDGRFDIGDLYLYGLGLKRKGGVARPR